MGSRFLVKVTYPPGPGQIVLRSDADWGVDVAPSAIAGGTSAFELTSDKRYTYFKPCLKREGSLFWSKGAKYLVTADGTRDVYPFFFADERGTFGEGPIEVPSAVGAGHRAVVYLPPGYDENLLKRYPTLYMHDAQNLFFPAEAYGGQTWQVSQTLEMLAAMNVIDKVIVIGVYPNDRMDEYTRSGYVPYGDFLARELKPLVDARLRTLPRPETTAVMGASLGGVVSLHVGLAHSSSFGMCGCMSSTFGYEDDLLERVEKGPLNGVRIYLDSGWPDDNFEATRVMRDALRRRGLHFGNDYLYFAFPQGLHNEKYWAMRSHIPYQFFFGSPKG